MPSIFSQNSFAYIFVVPIFIVAMLVVLSASAAIAGDMNCRVGMRVIEASAPIGQKVEQKKNEKREIALVRKIAPIKTSAPRLLATPPTFEDVALVDDRAEDFDEEELSGLHLDPELSDIEMQLESLPYREYRLKRSFTKSALRLKADHISFVNSNNQRHTVGFNIGSLVGSKVDVVLDWRGPKNEQLLSTKLRIPNGKHVIVGTEHGGSTSTVLCLRFDCW